MSNLIISAVPITLLDHIFPKCISQFEKVVEKAPNDISIETIRANLYSGKTMLVVVSEEDKVVAAHILEVSTFDTGWRVLFIPIIGGERMDEWMDRFLSIINAIAIDLKCDELRGMACRKGWLRALKPHGWYGIHEVVGCKVKQLEEDA